MSRPRLNLGSHLLPGVAAVVLFGVFAAVVLTSSFGPAQGFPADANVVASIGRAMFGLGGADVASESFLVAFEIVDLVLVAALAGAVLLARREKGGSTVTLLADGGRRLAGRDREEDD